MPQGIHAKSAPFPTHHDFARCRWIERPLGSRVVNDTCTSARPVVGNGVLIPLGFEAESKIGEETGELAAYMTSRMDQADTPDIYPYGENLFGVRLFQNFLDRVREVGNEEAVRECLTMKEASSTLKGQLETEKKEPAPTGTVVQVAPEGAEWALAANSPQQAEVTVPDSHTGRWYGHKHSDGGGENAQEKTNGYLHEQKQARVSRKVYVVAGDKEKFGSPATKF